MPVVQGDTVTVHNRDATVKSIFDTVIRCRYDDTNQIVDVPKAKLATPNTCMGSECERAPAVRVTINAPGNYDVQALCSECAETYTGTYVSKEGL